MNSLATNAKLQLLASSQANQVRSKFDTPTVVPAFFFNEHETNQELKLHLKLLHTKRTTTLPLKTRTRLSNASELSSYPLYTRPIQLVSMTW